MFTESYEIKNAVIENISFSLERGLSIGVQLNYGGSGQMFGGYVLYKPEQEGSRKSSGNYCGHFIWRLFEIAGVQEWSHLVGRTVRVKACWSRVKAIGHIIKDDWFDPEVEFAAILSSIREDFREGEK